GIRDWSVTGVQTCALPILSQLCAFCSPDRRKESAKLCYGDFSTVIITRENVTLPSVNCRMKSLKCSKLYSLAQGWWRTSATSGSKTLGVPLKEKYMQRL